MNFLEKLLCLSRELRQQSKCTSFKPHIDQAELSRLSYDEDPAELPTGLFSLKGWLSDDVRYFEVMVAPTCN